MKGVKFSLRAKILVILLSLVIIPSLIFGITAGRNIKSESQKNLDEKSLIISRSLTDEADHFLKNKIQAMEMAAELYDIQQMEPHQPDKALKIMQDKNTEFALIFMTDERGMQIGRSDGREKLDSLADRPYFAKMKETGKTVVSDIVISKTTNKPSVVIAVPLVIKGKVKGMLGGTLNLDALDNFRKNFKVGETGYAFITDRKGIIISHPDEKLVLEQKDVSDLPVVAAVLKGDDEGLAEYEYDGIKKYGAYNKVHLTGWVVVSSQPLDEAYAAAKSQTRLFIFVSLTVILLTLMIGWIGAQKLLLMPLQSLIKGVGKVSSGDFTEEVKVESSDELAVLAREFNEMTKNVSGLMSGVVKASETVDEIAENLFKASIQVNEMADSVTTAINQIAAGNSSQAEGIASTNEAMRSLSATIDQIAEGVHNQETNIRQTVNVVEEMVQVIDEISQNARGVASSTEESNRVAMNGKTRVDKTVDSMKEINESVQRTADKIKELGKYSEEIGNIVQVIDGIAEQSNLLALNAAIEAARAGEHGKGFAVVAEEVRKLAERSSTSTKEIAALIMAIQSGIETVVHAMAGGTEKVAEGSRLSLEAGETLQQILDQVRTTIMNLNSISVGTSQMSASSAEARNAIEKVALIAAESTGATDHMSSIGKKVAISVAEVSAIIEESASATEEVAAAAQQMTSSINDVRNSLKNLTELARQLRGAASSFKFKSA